MAVATGLMIAFQNCAKQGAITSANEASSDSVAMRKSLSDLKTQILTTSARDLTCATDADCAVVPVGAAHCGSPTFNTMTSAAGANYQDVLAMARQYRDLERNYAAANQMVGTCVAPAIPDVACVQNRCVAQ